MFNSDNQRNHTKRLLGLMFAVAGLMNLLVLRGYSSTRAAMSVAATKTSGSRPTAPSLLSSSGESTQALGSKANGKIAFASTRDGAWGIYVMNADGSNQTRLTLGIEPAWSPDGSKIAFVAGPDSSSLYPNTIYVMNADGSNPIRLTIGSDPAWSPDGNKIAFVSIWSDDSFAYSLYQISVMNADGSNAQSLPGLELVPGVGGPAWSPHGTKIACPG